jgi:hypothetical protein
MDDAVRDARIQKLEDRFDDIETNIKTAKIWVKVIGSLLVAFNISWIPLLYGKYKAANKAADDLNTRYAAQVEALNRWDAWSKQHTLPDIKPFSPPPPPIRVMGDGVAQLATKIDKFRDKQNPNYVSDVQDLRRGTSERGRRRQNHQRYK